MGSSMSYVHTVWQANEWLAEHEQQRILCLMNDCVSHSYMYNTVYQRLARLLFFTCAHVQARYVYGSVFVCVHVSV